MRRVLPTIGHHMQHAPSWRAIEHRQQSSRERRPFRTAVTSPATPHAGDSRRSLPSALAGVQASNGSTHLRTAPLSGAWVSRWASEVGVADAALLTDGDGLTPELRHISKAESEDSLQPRRLRSQRGRLAVAHARRHVPACGASADKHCSVVKRRVSLAELLSLRYALVGGLGSRLAWDLPEPHESPESVIPLPPYHLPQRMSPHSIRNFRSLA